jgi:hypothetical protein
MLLSQEISNPALGNLGQRTGISFFQSFIPSLVGFGFLLGSLVFFFMMIVGAIEWITSGGDKARVEMARGRLTSAIIGIVILLAIFAFIKVLEGFFGIDILTLDIGPLQIR